MHDERGGGRLTRVQHTSQGGRADPCMLHACMPLPSQLESSLPSFSNKAQAACWRSLLPPLPSSLPAAGARQSATHRPQRQQHLLVRYSGIPTIVTVWFPVPPAPRAAPRTHARTSDVVGTGFQPRAEALKFAVLRGEHGGCVCVCWGHGGGEGVRQGRAATAVIVQHCGGAVLPGGKWREGVHGGRKIVRTR